jgi:RNA polymerase sigma-70 factor (ECF subfamily)
MRRNSPMEPTYTATPFRQHAVEFRREVASHTAIAAVVSSDAELHNPVHRVSESVSVVSRGHSSDEQLLAAARSGDGQAFVELCGRYALSIHSRVFRILRNREDTEDALQEALFKAYRHLGQFRGACKFSTWLTRIAINSALMQLRRRRSHSEVSFDLRGDDDQSAETSDFPDSSPNAEQMYAKRQAIDRLSHAVQRLPSLYRSMISQYHVQERSMNEAADNLGITTAAAKSRLLRARLALRSTLSRKRISMTDACF